MTLLISSFQTLFQIKDEKVPNKGDYKTWQKYDLDDFDKSIDEELKDKDGKKDKKDSKEKKSDKKK